MLCTGYVVYCVLCMLYIEMESIPILRNGQHEQHEQN